MVSGKLALAEGVTRAGCYDRPAEWVGGSLCGDAWRKVRTPTGSRLDNVQARRRDGKCNRKIPPEEVFFSSGKGEMVR